MYDNYGRKSIFNKDNYSAGGKLGLAFILMACIEIFLYWSIGSLLDSSQTFRNLYNSEITRIIITISISLISVGFAFLIAEKPLKPQKQNLPKFKPSDFILFFLACYSINMILAIISPDFFKATVGQEQEPPEALKQITSLAMIIYTVIIAPTVEEITARYFIYHPFEKFGALPAIFFSALYFGVMHGNLYQLFYTFPIGLIWGYAMFKFHSLKFNILLHSAINFFEVIRAEILFKINDSVSAMVSDILVLMIILGLIAFIYILANIKNRYPESVEISIAAKTYSTQSLLLNPIFLFGVGSYLYYMYIFHYIN